MKSIHRDLTYSLAGNLTALAILCGAALYGYMHWVLTADFDRALLEKANIFTAMSEQDAEIEGDLERNIALEQMPPGVRDALRQVDGRVIETEEIARGDHIVYEVDLNVDGVKKTVFFSEDGTVIKADGEFVFEVDQALLPEYQPSSTAEYFQVRDDDGDTLARSPSLEGADLPRIRARWGEPAYENIDLPDGRAGRAIAIFFEPRALGDDSERLLLVMARSRGGLNFTLATFFTGLVVTVVLLALGSVLLVRQNVTQGLAPLAQLASETMTIDVENLTHRFGEAGVPEELQPIRLCLNELLERLDAAFQREKRFTADVAHELRTPIAELRTLAEVRLRATDDPSDDTAHAFQDALAISIQMERLVETLLRLARGESGTVALKPQDFDLIARVQSAWKHLGVKASDKNLVRALHMPDHCNVHTDPEILGAMLNNLLTNAIRYTPAGGALAVCIVNEASMVVLSIENDTNDLARDDLERMREPFWRKDAARTDMSHSGLGLAVVSAFAKLLAIEFRIEMPEAGRVRVVLELPRATSCWA